MQPEEEPVYYQPKGGKEMRVLTGTAVIGMLLLLVCIPWGEAEMHKSPNVIEVQGTLVKVKMTNFDWNPWEEYALKDEDGNLTILIGKKAELLKDYLGRELVVKGLVKPPLSCKGKKTTTVEIKDFTLIENTDRGD